MLYLYSMKKVTIETDYIKLGQLLKYLGLVETGGTASIYLSYGDVEVDGMTELRRGRKILPGSVVKIDGEEYIICK